MVTVGCVMVQVCEGIMNRKGLDKVFLKACLLLLVFDCGQCKCSVELEKEI